MLALALPADLHGLAQGHGEDLLQRCTAVDLAPDVADQPHEAGTQELELVIAALNCLACA